MTTPLPWRSSDFLPRARRPIAATITSRPHFDGSSWSRMPGVETEYLYGVWGSSATDVFAVGAGGAIFRYAGNDL